MNILMLAGIVIFLAWAYVLFVRPLLEKKYPVQSGKIEAVEERLWAGSRTIFFARIYWIGGVIVAIHDFVVQSGADSSTLVGEIANFLPEKYRPLALAAFLFLTGLLMEWLRRITTTPVGDKGH